jgi:hypothetical protein
MGSFLIAGLLASKATDSSMLQFLKKQPGIISCDRLSLPDEDINAPRLL